MAAPTWCHSSSCACHVAEGTKPQRALAESSAAWSASSVDTGTAPVICALKCPNASKNHSIPTVAVQPLEWYFNAPEDRPWVKRTRDVALDPRLLRVEEVLKSTKLENKARHARPFGWQESLRAWCVFADAMGGEVVVSVRWGALLENPAWRQLDVVAYVQDWLPDHLDYVGRILRPLPACDAPVPLLPAPSTPELLESSVQIEELSEDEEDGPCSMNAADRALVAAAAELPEPDVSAELADMLDNFSRKRKFDDVED